MSAPDLSRLVEDLAVVLADNEELLSERGKILSRRTEAFLELDPQVIRQEWLDANSKGVLRRGKAVSMVLSKLSLCSREPVRKEDVSAFLEDLEGWSAASAEFERIRERMGSYLESFTHVDGSVDWGALASAVAATRELISRQTDALQSLRQLAGEGDLGEAFQKVGELGRCLDNACEAGQEVERRIGKLSSKGEDWLSGQVSACQGVKASMDGMRGWMGWNAARAQARSLGLGVLVDYLDDHAVGEKTMDSFECGIYRTMAMASLDETEGMNAFTGSRFTEVIRQYSRADQQLRELARQEIYYEVASRVPDLTGSDGTTPQAVRLQRALRSRGRNVSIRSVFSDCGDLVFSLCPCLLMSPLSVAQYLEPGADQFDLVVFDEASQLQTCKAVGALSRAREAVVVGDPKQMPPTSFFQGKVEDEDFEEVSDLESVLEDCLALNMPQTFLRWHYRSRHESLIAFSNKRFYEGRMLTFPSADDRTSHVTFTKVDGTFERGGRRVNQAEAVVAEIVRRSKDPELSHESVGVVTFNIPQQSLIDDLFQAACAKDLALDAWAHGGEEPLFIKNLENVQGDERDAILFSVTYAPDANGRMSMNFGPINREGGWRRLNVAVTRARSSMEVFSSIEPTDIDLNRTSSSGPASLKAFLEYAKRGSFGSVSMAEMQADEADDVIARELCEGLDRLGYRTRMNVGRSAYRVDAGVVDPADDGRYLAGILLDGRSYQMSGTTRDREIAQPVLLRHLGWDVTRVWAIDWWEDSEAVMERLKAFLERVLSERGEEPPTPRAPESAEAEEAEKAEEIVPSQEPEPGASQANEKVAASVLTAAAPAGETEASHEGGAEYEGPAGPAKSAEPIDPLTKLMPDEAIPKVAGLPQVAAKGDPAVVSQGDAAGALEQSPAGASGAGQECGPRCRPYVLANVDVSGLGDDFLGLEKTQVAALLDDILKVEAPIEEGLLYKRLAPLMGIGRMGTRIRSKCEEGLQASHGRRITQAGRTIVWTREQDPKEYVLYRVPSGDAERRSFDEIPLEEIAAAALDHIEANGPCEREDLVKGTLHNLDYARLTPAAREYLQKGITLGIRRRLYRREKMTYLLPGAS